MAYVSWSVVFGEQPSAAKWNILGTNDASFNDGTGITSLGSPSKIVFSGAKVTKSTTQSITTSVATAVSFNTETYDTESYHDNVTNNTRFTMPRTGYYLWTYQQNWNGGFGGSNTRIIANLYKNGSIDHEIFDGATAVTGEPSFTWSDVIRLSTNDYLEVDAFQASGGTLLLAAITSFSIVLLGT